MFLQTIIDSKIYRIDTRSPVDISIPLDFRGAQPNHFDAPPASARTLTSHGFIGDTRKGGSCNVETYCLTPHCNGTHTECVGHIVDERLSIQALLRDIFIPATLITVTPVNAVNTVDQYIPPKTGTDHLITREMLQNALLDVGEDFLQGLVVRTLPNNPARRSRRYMQKPPPFFSLDAIHYLTDRGVEHLLVDIPSVDRMFDEGMLSAHHLFWNVPSGSRELDDNTRRQKTITEMIYVPDEINDGQYLVNIQIPNFVADAAPSRVWLLAILPVS